MAYQPFRGYLIPNPLCTYILNMYDFTLVGFIWYINHFRLFNVKSFLYIYIRYIGFGLVGFYGISTIQGYLIPNPLCTYILNMLIYFGWVLCFRLFNGISTYQPFRVI